MTDGRLPDGTGLSSLRDEAAKASSPKASIPSADDIDDAVEAWHSGAGSDDIIAFFGWSSEEYVAWVGDANAIPQRPFPLATAQAIEARRAETGTGSVHESAVLQGCAQNTPQISDNEL